MGGRARTVTIAAGDVRKAPDILPLETLPDIARKARRLAGEIGATDFSYLFFSPVPGRGCLGPALDADYPGTSKLSRVLADSMPASAVSAILSQPQPCWFAPADVADRPRAMLSSLRWGRRIAAPVAVPGFALPLFPDAGPTGVAVYVGSDLTANDRSLCDLHARTLALFAVLARLHPPDEACAPTMSRREIECLRLAALGHTSEEIAEALSLSTHTANQYLATSAHKLNAVSRAQSVAKALRHNIID